MSNREVVDSVPELELKPESDFCWCFLRCSRNVPQVIGQVVLDKATKSVFRMYLTYEWVVSYHVICICVSI